VGQFDFHRGQKPSAATADSSKSRVCFQETLFAVNASKISVVVQFDQTAPLPQKWKLGQPRSISVRLILREIFYLSFRPPELGQPFWSFLLLVVAVQELKCLLPKVQVSQKSYPSKQPKPFKKDSPGTFSEDEIRTRAYLIYESGGTDNHADEDWSQAETELMELVGGK